MIQYDGEFTPPAPVLAVKLAGAVHARPRVEVPALIDTGSDVTAVPAHLVRKLRLYRLRRIRIEDVEAREVASYTYAVRLTVGSYPTREMEVILTGLPFAVLGRDWLQGYYLLLNGPDQNFLLSETPILEER
jgi:predicted aspartyl protease